MIMLAVSAWHLRHRGEPEVFTRSARIALIVLVPAMLFTLLVGDELGVIKGEYQPMKIAAAEAQWALRRHTGRCRPTTPGTTRRGELMTTGSGARRVVIVGLAGLFAVQALARAPVERTLIDRAEHHLFQPMLYQCATGILSEGKIAAPLRQLLKSHRNAEFVLAEVTGIDADRRQEGRRGLARRPDGHAEGEGHHDRGGEPDARGEQAVTDRVPLSLADPQRRGDDGAVFGADHHRADDEDLRVGQDSHRADQPGMASRPKKLGEYTAPPRMAASTISHTRTISLAGEPMGVVAPVVLASEASTCSTVTAPS